MVTIKSHEQRMNEKGEPFNVLILEGELEMVQSQETGKYYATARQASIPSTFDESTCEDLIGKQIPGIIERVPSDPYEYTTEDGQTIVLSISGSSILRHPAWKSMYSKASRMARPT